MARLVRFAFSVPNVTACLIFVIDLALPCHTYSYPFRHLFALSKQLHARVLGIFLKTNLHPLLIIKISFNYTKTFYICPSLITINKAPLTGPTASSTICLFHVKSRLSTGTLQFCGCHVSKNVSAFGSYFFPSQQPQQSQQLFLSVKAYEPSSREHSKVHYYCWISPSHTFLVQEHLKTHRGSIICSSPFTIWNACYWLNRSLAE